MLPVKATKKIVRAISSHPDDIAIALHRFINNHKDYFTGAQLKMWIAALEESQTCDCKRQREMNEYLLRMINSRAPEDFVLRFDHCDHSLLIWEKKE